MLALSAIASAAVPHAYLSLCCNQNSAVSVYARVDGRKVANLPGVIRATNMALSPGGKTLFLNGSAVSVTSTASGKILATIPLPFSRGDGALAVSPDGRWLYVGDGLDTDLYVVDTASNKIVATPSLPTYSESFAMSPNGKTIYIPDGFHIYVFDTRSLKITATFALPDQNLAVTPDNKHLLGTSYANGVAYLDIIDAASGAVTASIPLAQNVSAGTIAVTHSGDRAYVGIGSGIDAVDLKTYQIVGSIPMKSFVFGMAITPDDVAIFALDDGALVRIDIASSTISPVAIPEGAARQVVVSPDGESVLVLNETDSAFSMVDLATQIQTSFVPVGEGAGPVIVTPDGTQTWVSGYSGITSIFDNVTHRPLTSMVGSIGQPAPFHPNGELVYNVDYSNQVLTAIDTKTHRVVRKSAPLPSFSGSQIAASSDARTVYVALIQGYGPYSLLAFDAFTLDLIATVPAPVVQWLAQNPRLPLVYSFGFNAICVIDTRTHTQVAQMTTPPGTTLTSMAVTPDGTFGYAGDMLNLYSFNLTTNQPIGTVAVRATSVAFSPDGQTAYAIWGNMVSVIDRASGVVTGTFMVGDSATPRDAGSSIAVAPY